MPSLADAEHCPPEFRAPIRAAEEACHLPPGVELDLTERAHRLYDAYWQNVSLLPHSVFTWIDRNFIAPKPKDKKSDKPTAGKRKSQRH